MEWTIGILITVFMGFLSTINIFIFKNISKVDKRIDIISDHFEKIRDIINENEKSIVEIETTLENFSERCGERHAKN